ncbi:leucine-rich repeat flightless-interacting protein 2 isoform X3 [Phycodurus eques]|uniref:leucine-rich repeat flightless-interacting protein 2 isoform X3 n=1 Tax=Phycodurus eques TaxID=693459 RepID=UPI002ACD9D07|nr:leucine-rich repeat flightless-interacting protein 2 isoform X3 [Phycodurus eques]
MGTQGPGRKRLPNLEKLTAEDDALKQIAREAEARLAARRAARAEARDIRMKELERQHKEEDGERYSRHLRRIASLSDDEERMSVGSRGSLKPSDYSSFLGSGSRASSRASSARASPVVEDRLDRDFLDRGSRTALNLSAATLSPLGGASSRRGSCDTSISIEMEASIREMKDSVAEAEEKYRRAMVSNAQLHNDKSTLMYQVETLREELSDMEELLWEARRQSDERTKAYERERDCHFVLQFQFKEMKETMRRSEELLMEASQLREQTHAYSLEVSDLQEALQWKEKKIAALERQREISDVIQIERDQLRVEVLTLRDILKKYGEVISPEVATNGGPRLDEAEEEVSNSFASQLAKEAPGSRESMLGSTGDMTSRHCQINKPSQSLSFISIGKHVQASNVSREARARKQMTYKGRRKDQMRTFPTRLKGKCVSKNRAITKQALKQRGNSALELTFVPKFKSSVESPDEAQLSKHQRESHTKLQKSTSHISRKSTEKVHKPGKPLPVWDMILEQKNLRSGNSAEQQKTYHITLSLSPQHKTLQYDSNRSTGQTMNEKLAQGFFAPTGVRDSVDPHCSASLIREDCEDCPAKYEGTGNTSEKCETSNEEAAQPNMTDFLTKWPADSATSDAVGQSCKFRRFVEEIKVMAAPEWVLQELPEGKLFEEQHCSQILETNMQAIQEASVEDMDSCEEAHEEMAQ